MSISPKRVVITGLGVVSAVGIGVDKFWQALRAGQSGLDFITSYPTADFPINFAAEIKDFNPIDFVPRKSIKVMARDIQLAVAAARLAFEDGNLEKADIPPDRLGVSLGAGLINADLNELGVVAGHSLNQANQFDIKKFGEEGIRELAPLWLLKQLPNMLSSHVSITYNAQGPSNSVTAGCSSAILAIAESRHGIQKGLASTMLCGGADSKTNPLSLVRFYLLKILAQGWSKPQEASRPFDGKRNGLVVAEGAGVMVLEELGQAKARGAKIYAEVIGSGSSFSDIEDRVQSIQAKVRAMQKSLDDAGITKEEINLISCHGLSTIKEDDEERKAIQTLFGERASSIPLIAPMSLLGYSGAACGALGLAAALLAIKDGLLVSHPNFIEREDGDELDYVIGSPRQKEINCAMVNAFGLGGQNGVLVIRKFTE